MLKLSSGQQLSARYIVRERLSAGTLGETWRALDTVRNCDVIIKVLRAELAQSSVALESLRAEVDSALKLSHPGIAGGYALEREGEDPYLVRDYVAGRDLSSLRAQPWRIVGPAMVDVAEALAAMHAQGLVHRDVKSSNVIVAPDGSVKIIDLGAAALAGDVSAPSAGSPYSQSPQQLNGEPPTPGDDLYAFGALLYELLGGYPPFYPNISRERVSNEAPPRLRPVHPAPVALVALAMQLLEKDPARRPQSLAEVATELRELLARSDEEAMAANAAALAAQARTSSVIRPIVRPPDRSAARAADGAGRRQRWFVGTGIAVLVALAIAVFVALPEYSEKVTAVKPAPAPAQAPAKPAGPAEPEDLEALAEAMDQAEQARGAFDAMLQSLEARGATEWAAQPLAAARALGETARKEFGERKFVAATASFKNGLNRLQEASDAATKILKRELERGAAALAAGQSAVAREAFALARKIDPQNAAAARGMGRAETLDQVIALVTAASNDERASQWSAALDKYRHALALDAETRTASEGVARVEARIASDAYAAAMSQGLAALNAGRLADARASFQRAGQIRPGTREVNDALTQVAQSEERRQIAAHRGAAEEHERAERWADALKEYDAALAVDGSLEFARAGRERVTPRAELAKRLDVHIQQPDRLTSPAVREQAYELVAEAKRIPSPGPVLTRQIEQVSANLARVEAPVRVSLESDNATVVVIHRIGPLGAFGRREVDLMPGRYTVVGTRMGYRDVRRELNVLPGQTPPPLVVRCEEKI
jgi:hypothetical protein